MKICRDCKKYNICDRGKHIYGSNSIYAGRCKDFQQKLPTNAERIKTMSVAEMADFLYGIARACGDSCDTCDGCPLNNAGDCSKEDIRQWLENEVSE